MDLYKKYQPTNFGDMVQSSKDIKTLHKLAQSRALPDVMLLHGPQGTGKSLTANIASYAANCTSNGKIIPCMECETCRTLIENPNLAITKINASDNRGIDNMRSIIEMFYAPNIYGFTKIFIIEEFEQVTADAQKSLKEPLSTLPDNVKVILTTNEMKKINDAILDRCQKYQFGTVTIAEAIKLIKKVAEREDIHITQEQMTKMIEATDSRRPRYLLQTLQAFRDQGEDAILFDPMETDANPISRILNMMIYKDPKLIKVSEIIGDLDEYINQNGANEMRLIILNMTKNMILNPVRISRMSESTKIHFLNVRYPIIAEILLPELSYSSPTADMIYRIYTILGRIRNS